MTVARPARASQYISFSVAGEEYAVTILRAREIVEYDTVTRVPMMPPAVVGVLNLRGRVVPVVDLATKFGLPATQVTRWTCILIVETEADGELTQMGLLIDRVGDVVDLDPEDIEPAPAFGTKVHLDQLLGLGKVGKRLVLLLDIDRVLCPEELLAGTSVESVADTPSALPRAGHTSAS